MSDASVHPSAHQLAAAVQAMIEPVFASLEDLAGEVVSCRRDAPGPSTERSFAPLEAAIAPRLAAHPALDVVIEATGHPEASAATWTARARPSRVPLSRARSTTLPRWWPRTSSIAM